MAFQKTNKAESFEALSPEDQKRVAQTRLASVIDPKQEPSLLKELRDSKGK